MAATVSIRQDLTIGGTKHLYTGSIAMDNSYPTGGEPIDVAGNERFGTLIAQSTAGYVFSFDSANQKLLAYRQKDPGNAGGADIALPEVASTTDLSALTAIDFIAIGS